MPSVDVHINQYVEIDVELSEFNTDDLIKEIRSREVSLPFSLIDSEQAIELAERYKVALYQKDNLKLVEAAKNYFDAVHGITC